MLFVILILDRTNRRCFEKKRGEQMIRLELLAVLLSMRALELINEVIAEENRKDTINNS